MARKPGDTNYSERDLKHLAQIAELKAKNKALQAKVKVKEATLKEVRSKLGK